MGRRSLPKIPSTCDYTGHLWRLEELPPDFSLDQEFGGERPIELEIGSGKGLFLASAAARYPDRSFCGIELRAKYAQFSAARLARQQLSNARMIQGDAEQFVRERLSSNTMAAVHVYFPDPWWKKRHHKRRIMNREFLLQVARVLAPDGRLHFWTDVEEYFRLTLELIRTEVPLSGPLEVPQTEAEHDLDYRTHFERRTRLAGQPVYRAEFIKSSDR